MPNDNLADFDKMGVTPPEPTKPEKEQPVQKKPPKKESKPVDPRKVGLGCLGIAVFLFLLLIVTMVMGLAAGDATVQSFGFDPTSFKRWTIGLVNFVFGAVALSFIVAFVIQIIRIILTNKEEADRRYKFVRHGIFHFVLFVTIIVIWVLTYGYLLRFLEGPSNFKVEILSDPVNTFSLTSPITVNLSAELVTRRFAKEYDIVSYEWDREGDGYIDATGEKVQLYFPNGGKENGVFPVNLLVRMQLRGTVDETITKEYKKVISIAKQEMYGEIIAERSSGDVPLTTTLDASKIRDPQGARILNYSWDLNGDGRSDFDGPMYMRVEHTFETIGDHPVTVTVTSEDFDDSGARHETKTFTKVITVHEPSELKDADAIIQASPKSGIAPLTVNFDANKSGKITKAKIERYEWIVGDGIDKFYGVSGSYRFKKPGKYPVMLKVTYMSGQVKTETIMIQVSDPTYAPKAVITTKPNFDANTKAVAGPAPLSVSFDATSSKDRDNNIISYEWDFDGDGVIDSEGSNASYKYRDEGKYRARLIVTDADGTSDEAVVNIVVNSELPTFDFGASAISGPVPLTVDFDASGSRLPGRKIVSYEWNFSTGSKRGQSFIYGRAQTSHIFPTPGEYLVELTLHGDDGSKAKSTQKIIATYESLEAKFTPSRLTGSAPLAITFDASKSTGEIARYAWSFGDGNLSGELTPLHMFFDPGEYTVTLKVYDNFGNVSSTNQQVTVK